MNIKAIAIAIALVGGLTGAGGYYAGQSTAVAVATCQGPAVADRGYAPKFTPLPMTGNPKF